MIVSDKRNYLHVSEEVSRKLAMCVLPSIGISLMAYSAFVEYKDGSTHIFQLLSMAVATVVWMTAIMILRKIYNNCTNNCRFVQGASDKITDVCDKKSVENKIESAHKDEGQSQNMGVVYNKRKASIARKVEHPELLMNKPYDIKYRVTSMRVKLYLAVARVVLNAGRLKNFSMGMNPVEFYADQWECDIMYVGNKKRQLRFASARIPDALSIVLRHGWPSKLLQLIAGIGRQNETSNRICNDQSKDCTCKETLGVTGKRYM